MTRFESEEALTIEDGQLVRVVTGKVGKFAMDVAKIYEDGRVYVRNIDCVPIAGWVMAVPGRKYHERYYGTQYTATLDPWTQIGGKCEGISYHLVEKADERVICKLYPDFKWVLKKADKRINTNDLFKLLPLWKKYPSQVEALVAGGFYALAINSKTYTAKDKKQILGWLREHPEEGKEVNLNDIRVMLRENIGIPELNMWKLDNRDRWSGYLTYKEWKWLDNRSRSMYRDYKEMAKEAGHDLKDPYWHFPKDLKKAHDKVMREVDNIRAMKKVEELKKKQTDYIATIKRFLGKTYKGRGVEVFVPDNVQQIEKQAKALHQCLIANNYIDKVIKKEIVLVFVVEKGESLATAELICKGRKFMLGQFYGDEAKENCNAPRKAQTALKKWAELHKIRMVA